MFDVGLRLLAHFETQLLPIEDDIELILTLNELSATLYDFDALLFYKFPLVPMHTLSLWRCVL